MASWEQTDIIIEGKPVKAQAPAIVSASRSTDIPAFYADWFFDRLEKGYSAWTNPFNGVKSYVSYRKTRFIVFWSKNPRPLLSYLDENYDLRNVCEGTGAKNSLSWYQNRRRLTGDLHGQAALIWCCQALVGDVKPYKVK